MKRTVNVLLLLSGAGALIAALLIIAHYYPDMGRSLPLCGESASCADLNRLPYSMFLGIPIAAYGLFFYLVVLFTLLIADAAGDRYYRDSAVLLLPLCALALLIDAGLGIVLIVLGEFCPYCVTTYIINIILFILLLHLFRAARSADGVSYRSALRGIFAIREAESERRAVYALYIVCIGLIFFSVFSLTYALGIKTTGAAKDIQSYIDDFYKTPPKAIDFPKSTLETGNSDAPLTIYVFTDFLCSACNQLYKNEKILLRKFERQIKFSHYNYPLDETCNESVSKTIYKNSCIASYSMLAASEAGVFTQYLENHYARYGEYSHNFSPNDVTINIGSLADGDAFKRYMESPPTADIIRRDVALARKLGINGTPALFVNGRMIEGAVPVEVMERIISKELSTLKGEK